MSCERRVDQMGGCLPVTDAREENHNLPLNTLIEFEISHLRHGLSGSMEAPLPVLRRAARTMQTDSRFLGGRILKSIYSN